MTKSNILGSNNLQQQSYVITDRKTLRVLMDDLRGRIMVALANEPRTIHQVAADLNLRPSNLYYHFQMLLKHGLIVVAAIRPLAGAVKENSYITAARIFKVDTALLTVADLTAEEQQLIERLETTLGGAYADILDRREADLLDHHALELTEPQVAEFVGELNALVERFVGDNMANGTHSLTVALYQLSNSPE